MDHARRMDAVRRGAPPAPESVVRASILYNGKIPGRSRTGIRSSGRLVSGGLRRLPKPDPAHTGTKDTAPWDLFNAEPPARAAAAEGEQQ